MAEDLLTIQRLRLDCRTGAGAKTAQVQEDLKRVATSALGPAMQSALDQAMPAEWRGSHNVLYMPRLDVSLDLDTDVDRDTIARVWGRILAAEILRALADPDVLRFEDAPTHLAAFVVDYLEGRAWQSGLWRDFDGLKPLAPSVAIRTVLLRDSATGLEACRKLRSKDLHRCLATLRKEDARCIVDAFLNMSLSQPVARALDTLAQGAASAVQTLPHGARQSPDHFAFALLVVQPTLAAAMLALGGARVRAVTALVLSRLRTRAKQASSPDANPTQQTKGPPPKPAWAEALTPSQARAVAAAVAEAMKGSIAQATFAPLQERTTPFGGAFLLWPHIQALPWDVLLPEIAPDRVSAAKQAVLARALGADLLQVLHDPALSVLFDESQGAPEDLPSLDVGSIAHRLRPWFAAEDAADTQWRRAGALWVLTSGRHGYWTEITHQRPATNDGEAGAESPTILADMDALELDLETLFIPWLAQIVCKRLAYRLPGFGDATVGFLRQNILPVSASVLAGEEDAVQVTLDHAPLGIMLNLTGLARQSYEAPRGKTIQLAQGDQR